MNGVQGYQGCTDHRVPDQAFVPQLHHQTWVQIADLAVEASKNKHNINEIQQLVVPHGQKRQQVYKKESS